MKRYLPELAFGVLLLFLLREKKRKTEKTRTEEAEEKLPFYLTAFAEKLAREDR